MVARVELDPVQLEVLVGVLKLQTDDWAFLLLVEPVPKRDRLSLANFVFGSQSHYVLVVRRQVHHFDSIWMWVQESTYWRCRERVPNDKHRVVADISSDYPSFVL